MKIINYLCITSLLTHTAIEHSAPSCTKKKIVSIASFYDEKYPFLLPDLPYAFDSLEPYIDTETMKIHHNNHHKAYVDNLNGALKDHPALHNKTLFELLANIEKQPANIKTALRNQAGGHFNHSLFWTIMSPLTPNAPSKKLEAQIIKDFGSFASFQEKFNSCAKSVFGSGWAWLVTDRTGRLSIIATHNQDSPVSDTMIPILGLDVWEHAYYLKYQNRRNDYISSFWHIINWKQVDQYYLNALQ